MHKTFPRKRGRPGQSRRAPVVMERYGLRTKTEAVELALRNLAGQPMTRDEALAMRGAHAIAEIPEDTRPADAG